MCNDSDNILIFGISQNPDTEDYIIVLKFHERLCVECFEEYTDINYKWCKPCQINDLKANFPDWTSENEIIDRFIQEMHLKIYDQSDIIFKWIPYNQFINIEEVNRHKSTIIYLAKWKDGSLYSKNVVLKCLYSSQNNIDRCL